MASIANGVFLLSLCQFLPSLWATNPIFFPCENNTDLTAVDCSGRNLTRVPLIKAFSVLSLNLDLNKIQKLGRFDFAGVPHLLNLTINWNCPPAKLKYLGVPACELQIDAKAFIGLKNLTSLFLIGNSLIHVPAFPDHLEVLSMEYNKLSNITEPLGTPHLQQLFLTKNCYYANPCNQTFFIDERVFQGLPNLRNLTLGYNNITEVPTGLPPSLESLDLKENKISEIKEQAFANLSKLSYLNLEWNCQRCDHAAQPCFPCVNNTPIKLYPGSFRNQVQMTRLSIRGNSLRDLPDKLFSNMPNLSSLDLSDNLLAYAIRNGTFFKDLKNVTTLNLIYNYEPRKTFKSLSLSPHISEMISLKNLLLSGYFFHELTLEGIKPLLNLIHLEKLDLRLNFVNLCHIDIFKEIKALKHIILSQNMLDFMQESHNPNICQSDSPRQQIEDTMRTEQSHQMSDYYDDPEIWTFYKLYCRGKLFFDLSQNNIFSLRESTFKGMEGMFCLDLSYNYLSQSLNGKQFVQLKNLTYLNMAFNRIDLYYDGAFQEVRGTLKVLDLSNNGFHFFMKGMGHRFEFIQNLTSLEVLSLSDNNIGIRISPKLWSSSLKYLFFAGNSLNSMWDNRGDQYLLFFTGLTNLTYLDISRNHLIYLLPEALCNLPATLITLNVGDNQLNYFPWDNLTVLNNLSNLNLSRNFLTELPSDVKFNPNLNNLDLSHNRIRKLPMGFLQAATSLRVLILNNNQLKLLDVQGPSLRNLQKVILHDNPFVCSCDTAWLSDFLRNSPVQFPKLTTNYKCGFPVSLQGQSVLSMDPRSCQEYYDSIGFLCTITLTIVFTLVPLLKKIFGWDIWYCIQIFWTGHKGYSMLQNSQHDAFVVFDTGNEAVRDWVYNELVVNLEDRGRRQLSLCLEERDWVLGMACIENLHSAVYNSKKTVFVLTNNGTVNGTLKQAFYMVQQRLLDEKVDAVILVLLDENFPKMKYIKMRKRLCRKSVLSWPRNPHAHQHFWNKMRAALATDNHRSYNKNINEGFISSDLI
ncbi:toll-like receptor 9 [Conger conger]|uniref:toll-like receptor 9 n=1 Tax=Conger conger TaxID=82655 RepID=UPI002A59EB56|nr:toll-like receptor 9 [Conger conger]